MPKTPNLLRSAEACDRLGINRSTLTRWVVSGKITPAYKLDGIRGAFLFHPSDVDRLVERLRSEDVAS